MEHHQRQRWARRRALRLGAFALSLLLLALVARIRQAASPRQQLEAKLPLGARGRARSLRPGGTPMELPTRQSWQRMQADPTLPERNASLLAEFESAPWLLPPRTPALAYAGVHDLDALLRLRAMPMGRHNKTVALLTFDQKFAMLSQNTIYSMVKLGGVRNYIVGTWSPGDLQACAAMNLPCADLSPWLPEPMNNEPGAGGYMTHDYLVIGWLRSVVMAHLLRQGYVVYLTDSDVAFVNKPVWDSYLAFIDEVGADGAFQAEHSVANIGNYVVLPTPATIRLFDAWAGSAVSAIQARKQDQFYLPKLKHLYELCNAQFVCRAKREEQEEEASKGRRPAAKPKQGDSSEAQEGAEPKALFRTFPPSFWMYSSDVCALVHPDSLPLVDTCDWSVLFLHPVCGDSNQLKIDMFKQQGLWFMDDSSCTGSSAWPACQLLRWRQPDAEQHLYACPEHNLALVHRRPQRQLLGTL